MTALRIVASGAAEAASPTVIALHCSGSTGRQWRHLATALGDGFAFHTPDLIGCGGRPHWTGGHPFRLADEAAPVVALIDAARGPVHLVGHSYGGGVALRAAIERPHRVASLSLYEPTAFHLLRSAGGEGRAALSEIRGVEADVARGVLNGGLRAAARRFVDYWNGNGQWDALNEGVQADLVRYIPKAVLDFAALIGERTPLVAYRHIRGRHLILQGALTTRPAAMVARTLAAAIRPVMQAMLADAGHMGPVTHAARVAEAIAAHIRSTVTSMPQGDARDLRAAA